MRRPGVEWAHSVQDAAAIIRDMTKWDDNPVSLPHFAESAVRAYKIAMTPPMGPVALAVDDHMQDGRAPADLKVPKLSMPSTPQGDSGEVPEADTILVAEE